MTGGQSSASGSDENLAGTIWQDWAGRRVVLRASAMRDTAETAAILRALSSAASPARLRTCAAVGLRESFAALILGTTVVEFGLTALDDCWDGYRSSSWWTPNLVGASRDGLLGVSCLPAARWLPEVAPGSVGEMCAS